ncbi:uncharacterized protein N7483_005827 [Penicillium malachiteum]|uniref:uncharacterized protein n=1 Tax=Penicillium malachiteum TaxID=1324776 RepID=UPI002546B868|nr:uncharacterized protein N7483_005827 [Penicillium malachiteum]KAJ5731319.1 hypothetical protein N7483_005827 [Penicillium malachiteum]
MAGIINKPLAFFRRPGDSKPLHTRWGDVAISVPTEGSWNQYDNPHRPTQEQPQIYGPGFVPDFVPSSSNRTKHRVHNLRKKDNDEEDEEEKEDEEHRTRPAMTRSASVASSRRNSLSLGSLHPGRLSVRLASRPKHLRGENKDERDIHRRDSQRTEFAYKPIQQDYTAEISETSRRTPPFRYIPTNGRYVEEIPTPNYIPSRSQSAMSHRSSRTNRGSVDTSIDSFEERDRIFTRRDSHHEDDRGSILSDGSDGSSSRRSHFGLSPRRRNSPFIPADRRQTSLLKPMTMAMVPDPDELYE